MASVPLKKPAPAGQLRRMDPTGGADWMKNQARVGQCLTLPEGVEVFNPKKEGAWELDFMCYDVGAGHPYKKTGAYHFHRPYTIHWTPGQNGKPMACPRNFGKHCTICAHANKIAMTPNYNKDELKIYIAKQRDLWLVRDRAAMEKKVQVWDVSPHLFGRYLQAKIDKASAADKPKWQLFADPSVGYMLRIAGTQDTAGATKFIRFSDIEFKKRAEPLKLTTVNHGICLDDIITEVEDAELVTAFFGDDAEGTATTDDEAPEAIEEDAPESTEETAAPQRPRKKPKPAAVEEEPAETEEETAEAVVDIEIGTEVSFIYNNKVLTGTVKKINTAKGLAQVDCGTEPYNVVKLDELTIVEAETEEGEETETADEWEEEEPAAAPPPKKKRPAPPAEEESETESEETETTEETEASEEEAFEDPFEDVEETPPPPKKKVVAATAKKPLPKKK